MQTFQFANNKLNAFIHQILIKINLENERFELFKLPI